MTIPKDRGELVELIGRAILGRTAPAAAQAVYDDLTAAGLRIVPAEPTDAMRLGWRRRRPKKPLDQSPGHVVLLRH